MDKPWSCGAIFAGLILAVIVLAAVGAIDLSPSPTAQTITDAQRACQAQTGTACD